MFSYKLVIGRKNRINSKNISAQPKTHETEILHKNELSNYPLCELMTFWLTNHEDEIVILTQNVYFKIFRAVLILSIFAYLLQLS